MSITLDIEVRGELERRRGEWRLIARNADVSYSWISQFCRGKIPNPGIETLKKLHTTLRTPASEDRAPA